MSEITYFCQAARKEQPTASAMIIGCGFSAYSWKLPPYNGAFVFTIASFSFLLAIGAFLLTVLAFLLTVGAFLLRMGKCF